MLNTYVNSYAVNSTASSAVLGLVHDAERSVLYWNSINRKEYLYSGHYVFVGTSREEMTADAVFLSQELYRLGMLDKNQAVICHPDMLTGTDAEVSLNNAKGGMLVLTEPELLLSRDNASVLDRLVEFFKDMRRGKKNTVLAAVCAEENFDTVRNMSSGIPKYLFRVVHFK